LIDHHTKIIKKIKKHVKTLPCLRLPILTSCKIIETDVSQLGYGGILKQYTSEPKEQIVRYHSSVWNAAQQNYSTIKKEKRNSINIFMYFEISR
jgi:phospholipid N-methyltransferase